MRAVAAITGIHPEVQRRVKRHVELGERFPFMQQPGWTCYSVLKAGAVFDKIPVADQQAAAAMVETVPPKTAIRRLEMLAQLPASQRKVLLARALKRLNRNRIYRRGM